MSEIERRPVIDPSILGRMAASMESIREGWQADVDELNDLKARYSDMERIMHSHADRLNDTLVDLANERTLNIDLVHRNAQLESDLRAMANRSLEASDHLHALAERAEKSTQPPAPASTKVAASPPSQVSPTTKRDLQERASQTVRGIGRADPDLEDDGTGLPSGLPDFIRRDRAEFTPQTRPPANKFPS